jgi:hypothetical protein
MEKSNFKKFEKLTALGRKAFQMYFDKVFPPEGFSKFLIEIKDVLPYGRGGSKFTDEQMKAIFPGVLCFVAKALDLKAMQKIPNFFSTLVIQCYENLFIQNFFHIPDHRFVTFILPTAVI